MGVRVEGERIFDARFPLILDVPVHYQFVLGVKPNPAWAKGFAGELLNASWLLPRHFLQEEAH